MVAKSVNNVQKGGGKRVFKNSLHEKLLAWKNGTDMSAVDEVAGIPETAWCGGGDIISFPSSLSPAERRIAHQLCLRLDLFHASSGEGENRFVTVSKSGDFESIQQSTSMDEVTSNYCIWYDERSVKPLVKSKYFCLTDTEIEELQKCLVTAPGTVNEKVTVSLCADFLLDFELRNLSNMSHLNAKFPEGGKNRSDVECEQDMDKHHKLVDTVEGLHEAAAALNACFEVAFDLEMHSYRTYHGLTCLIQLSGGGYNYIVDPLAPLLWDLIGPLLGPIFANPNIVMIGHGIMGGDIPALYRDFGIIVVNAFDTQEASGFLGRTGVGLAALLDLWGCPLKREIATLKDRMKHADWRLRPLSDVMLRYATLDVHYLVSLYKLQVRELLLSSVACMGRGDKTGYQGQDGIPLIKNPKKSLPPKGKGSVLPVPKECSLPKMNQDKLDLTAKKKEKEIVVSSGASDSHELDDDDDDDDENNERLEVNDDSLAVHMLLDTKNREALTTQDGGKSNINGNTDIYDDDEEEEGAEVWGLDPATEVEVEVGMEGITNNKNDVKSKLNYTNDRFHNEAGGEDDDDDIGEPEDDENCGILASQCIEIDYVEGDDDDDDLWDGWGEEVTAQDTTQNQIQNELSADANITNSSSSNIADDKKKGGGGDYINDIKYDKNNITNTTTVGKKNNNNNKNNKDGDGIKGPGSACKPVSSRAQQQQKRKEIKALKFDREKAKRLETIMIKAQKLQLYEEEKKLRNQNEQEKKEIDEKSTEKKEIGKFESKIEKKIEDDTENKEKIIEKKSLNIESKEIIVTPLTVTSSLEIRKTVEKSNTENRGVNKEEKEGKGEDEKEGNTRSIAGTIQEAVEVDATVVRKVVQKVRKDVEKEVEVCDGDTNHEYGDSDSVEDDDDDDDVDHEVEVEVGAKNVLTPSNQEDDDDALLKRRSLGRGFLRDIMAEYDKNIKPNLNVLKEIKESSLLTSKTEQIPLPLPLSSSVIATIRASDLGSDPRLSELLGTLAASQQSCLKLWSPKKVSENAYTKVSGFSQRKKTRVGGGQWEVRNVFVFRILFSWREKEAERRDESPSYICRGSLLLDAAEFLPVTLSALMKLQSPLPASMRPSSTSTVTACASSTTRAGKVIGTEVETETKTVSGRKEGAVESTRVVAGTGEELRGGGTAIATGEHTQTETEENTEGGNVIGVNDTLKESDDNNHLKKSDDGDKEIVGGGDGVDDVVDLVAAVKAALLSWESVMRKQNNSPSTDRPDDSSPELYREKHNKRSTYHNKNSPNVDGKSNNLADVTITDASVPRVIGGGVILNYSDTITQNPIKKNEVASDKHENLKVIKNDKKSTLSVASISLLCAATILSVGAFVFLRRKG